MTIGIDGRAYAGPDLIALAVLDLLGGAADYGFERPVSEPGMISILDGSEHPSPAYQLVPAEARWFAAELLRAADAAEEPTQ